MNTEQLYSTINNILLERRDKFDNGVIGAADDKYQGCITALETLISTGCVKTDADRVVIREALDRFNCHIGLGVIVDNMFKPISAAIAARWDIVEGSIISANKLPVFSRQHADEILADPYGAEYPSDTIRDEHRNAIIHLSFYYRRYPEKVLGLKSEDITRLGLQQLFEQQVKEI